MLAVRARPEGVEVVEVPEPEGDGLRLEVRAVGICGSDLKLLEQGALFFTPGHEVSGVMPDGTSVAVEPAVPCGACASCLRGDEQLCDSYWATFYGVGRDGGMAERMMVEERCVVPLPSGVDPGAACLVEPLAVCVHGMLRAGVQHGMRVGVVGAGTIGLCAAVAAQAAGAEVQIAARHPHQKIAAEALDAGLGLTDGYDVVVDAAGTNEALALAVGLARPGGSVLLLGSYFGTMELPGATVALREISIVPAITYGHSSSGRDVDSAAALLARRPEIADALITHRFPLSDAPQAFRAAQDRAAGAIKVVIEP